MRTFPRACLSAMGTISIRAVRLNCWHQYLKGVLEWYVYVWTGPTCIICTNLDVVFEVVYLAYVGSTTWETRLSSATRSSAVCVVARSLSIELPSLLLKSAAVVNSPVSTTRLSDYKGNKSINYSLLSVSSWVQVWNATNLCARVCFFASYLGCVSVYF